MLVSFKNLCHFTLQARDGEMGKIKDVFFDDASWKIRYLVVDTRRWFPGQKVLLSPAAVSGVVIDEREIRTKLSKEEVRSAPSIDENLPVSRQHELALSDYFGWPQYWYRTEPLGYPFVPTFMDYEPANTTTVNELREQVEQRLSRADKHLRSSSEVIRYDVITSDERRLKLQDMLIGVGDWDIPFVVIGASRHAQRHLAPTVYAGDINFSEQLLAMNLSEEKILASHPIHFDAPQFEEMRAISLHYFGASQRERPGDELSA